MSVYIPQPRYSEEHKAQAEREGRPLFTLDIWYPGVRRATTTGVLLDSQIEQMIARLAASRTQEGTEKV